MVGLSVDVHDNQDGSAPDYHEVQKPRFPMIIGKQRRFIAATRR
jgi:hypothetical protein